MKHTPLTEIHQSLGAKMAAFAGYLMPISYDGITVEHETVRTGVGVFDVSHMGEFLVTGSKAFDLLQRITSNDVSRLSAGKAQYSCFPNDKGGIVDDLIIYCLDTEKFLLVVNAANIEKDWNWITSQNKENATLRNLSDDYALLAIQGPKAIKAMQSLTSIDLSEIPYYTFKVADFAGIDHTIISATGYTGSGGFEIYCKNSEVVQIWNKVMKAGKEYGIKPIGLAARDTLRLEMGYCLYGNDIDDTTSPLEAGLGWITKFTKEFTNSMALSEQKKTGVVRKLVGFEMNEKGIPRQSYPIVTENDEVIGVVTSGTMSPSLKKGIGLGYVKVTHTKPGDIVYIKVRNKNIAATIIKPPFFKQKKDPA